MVGCSIRIDRVLEGVATSRLIDIVFDAFNVGSSIVTSNVGKVIHNESSF